MSTFPRRSIVWSLILLGGAGLMSSQAQQPTTAPATRPSGPDIERSASAVIKLWPVDPPATQPGEVETVQERLNEYGESDRAVRHVVVPTITLFLPSNPDPKRPAILICPGGGYGNEVFDREGYFIARAMADAGVVACVLKYRLPYGVPPDPGEQPRPVQDVLRALRVMRSHANAWNVDAGNIGIIGFSAGGHLAGTAATQFDGGDPSATDPIETLSSRPDFAALIYPVASMQDEVVHKGSRRALLGENASAALKARYSVDERISPRTPELFVVHARNDKVVDVRNSERIADAAKRAGVACELVLYDVGGHGFGLGLHAGEAGDWFSRWVKWMQKGGHVSGSGSAAPASGAKE